MCRPAFWSTEKNRKIHIRIVEIYYTPVKEKKKLMWPGVELIYEIWWTFDDIWMIYFYIWRKYNERMEIIKRGSLLGNEEPDFWGDSQVFDFFSFSSPLWNEENKSCLNELKFCEVSGNLKSSIYWKFHV